MTLFEATENMRETGLILVDTKYEFGKDKDENIILIDEVHTPDSLYIGLSIVMRSVITKEKSLII